VYTRATLHLIRLKCLSLRTTSSKIGSSVTGSSVFGSSVFGSSEYASSEYGSSETGQKTSRTISRPTSLNGLLLVAAVGVSACGGGGSSSPANATNNTDALPIEPVGTPGEIPGETDPDEIPVPIPGGEIPGQLPAQFPNLEVPRGEEPAEEESEAGEPTAEVPAEQEPAGGETAPEEPAGQEPAEQEPAGQEPAEQEPAGQDPAEQEPAEEPLTEAPAEEEPADEPEEVITSVNECTKVDVINVGTGTQRINIALQPGEHLVIDDAPRGVLVGFDETSGELDYKPPAGRQPDFFDYRIFAADNTVRIDGRMNIRLDPIRIMPLGDSITQGVEIGTGDLDLPPIPLRVGYRQSLLEQLSAAAQVVDFTGQGGQRAGSGTGISDADNGGYPGVDISFISNLMTGVLTEQLSDVLLLHIGTNQTPATAAGVEVILDEVDEWESTNHPVTVFVATLIPKRDPTQQQQVNSFNADLRARIAARQLVDDVILVEQADAVTVADIDPADVGVHPTAPGYLRMADTWFEAMRASSLFLDCL